jgi:hypothetical protein
MDQMEIIALVMPEAGDTVRSATVLLRDAGGTMSVRQIPADDERLTAHTGAHFRPVRPILDPLSREVMGYELEQPARAS